MAITITSMDELKEVVNEIVDYNWSDEERDYQEHIEENGEAPKEHIYEYLVAVDKFLNGGGFLK